MNKGRFITLEGGEGAGKSTQIEILAEYLRSQGKKVVTTREPGGSQGAEAIRTLLMNGSVDRWLPVSELLLYFAARHDHAERKIKPALADHQWVISDRFFDSTFAYQSYGMGLPLELVRQVKTIALGSFQPDVTFIFDIDPRIGLARSGDRQRYEKMDIAFHDRLRQGYLEIAKIEPQRCVVVDASRGREEVSSAISAELDRRFALSR